MWDAPNMSPATLVVVPTFDEADNIMRLVAGIRQALPSAHVLVVDDASPDGTAARVRQASRTDPQLYLLERHAKLGLGSAYVAGFAWGLSRGFDRFFEMDADFSHDPKYLPQFVAALDAGADVVVGSRNVPGGVVRGWGPVRHLLSKGGSWYSRLILSASLHDMTSGFKAYTRRALELIDIQKIRSNGYAFQIETTYRAERQGLKLREVPIVFVDRRAGASKMTGHEVWEAIWSVWKMRWSADRG
jgi:dolichol-phosphate mannosyltransferase